MIAPVLWQFGFGCLALLLRFSEGSCWRWSSRCGRCWLKCCRCCCCCCLGAGGGGSSCARCCSAVAWVLAHVKLRWYWFLLAVHVGFLLREAAVISLLDGWYFEVALAHGAIWLTLMFVVWEVSRFSAVRTNAPKTVDQVLDMLLLPLNYGFFCALCVRILKLQNSIENTEIVTAIINSADIWESWALWSVLELFVLVVDVAARRDPRRQNDSEYLETIKAFKTLSLHGVKAFFLILLGFTALDVIVKGVVAPYVPTLCYWLYKDCMSCRDWYHLHVNPVAQSIIYILCTFALIFVFTFEQSFADYLHCIQPYWKFWGVKCVVTVTYFQWLIISYCFGLNNNQIYLLHCIACCLEMPLLSAVHATCAYPYGKAWLERLLDHVPAEVAEQEPQECVQEPLPESATDQSLPPVPEASGAPMRAQTEIVAEPMQHVQDSPGGQTSSCILYVIFWTGCCYGMKRIIFRIIPPVDDIHRDEPLYNFMCNNQDLAHFVQEQKTLHWVLPANAEGQLRIPGTAGVWLPLCGVTQLGCAIGYQGSPSLTCTPDGEYAWDSLCQEVDCGPPLQLLHAKPHYDHQAWTSGMQVTYLCDKGYVGNPVAICEKSGNYTVHGSCTEVDCSTPPTVSHATPNTDPDQPDQKFKAGAQIVYRCDFGYRGRPVGTCGDNAIWSVTGQCTAVCGTPPILLHAIELFDRSTSKDITVGQRLRYKCEVGYGGHPVAVCNQHGEYHVESKCEVICGQVPEVPHATPHVKGDQSEWAVGSQVRYSCDAGYGGNPVAECGHEGHWTWKQLFAGECTYVACGSLDSFLQSEFSASWREVMDVKERLNFTSSDYGDVVFLECKEGYTGSPRATCVGGRWHLKFACVIDCGPPPHISHAVPDFEVDKALHGWTVGTHVTYRCDAGYGGRPTATCSQDGQWKFDAAAACVDLGCGSMDDFLTQTISDSWHDAMHVEDTINFTSSEYGDVIIFKCQHGYFGSPTATCVRRHWQLTGSCGAFVTARGCSCQTQWTLCKGWFGTNCEVWYGCTAPAVLDEPYSWCEVEKGSCPAESGFMGQESYWDYCSAGGMDITWAKKRVPDQGLASSTQGVLGVVCLAGASVVIACTYRLLRSRRAPRVSRALSVQLQPGISPYEAEMGGVQ